VEVRDVSQVPAGLQRACKSDSSSRDRHRFVHVAAGQRAGRVHHADERARPWRCSYRVDRPLGEQPGFLWPAQIAETVRSLPRQFESVEVADPLRVLVRVAALEHLLSSMQDLRASLGISDARQCSGFHGQEHRVHGRGRLAAGSGLRRTRELDRVAEIAQIVGLVAQIRQDLSAHELVVRLTGQT